MIDATTLEIVTKTRDEWQDLGQSEEGKFKNPKTETYTMVPPIECFSCGEAIPHPGLPKLPESDDIQALQAYDEKLSRLARDYRCPLCGGYAMPPGYQVPGMSPASRGQ